MYPALIILGYGPFAFVFLALWIGGLFMALWNARRHTRQVILLCALYLGTYGLLSLNGNYYLANHGGAHFTKSWTPSLVVEKYVIARTHIRPGPLAVVYWPLYVLDIWLWHPSVEPWEGYYTFWCVSDDIGPQGC